MNRLSVTKSLALTGLGSGARLISSFISISVTARCLGSAEFGSLMFALSLASLLVVPMNFGLSTYVLRSVAQAPSNVESLVSEAMSARCLAIVLFLPLSAVALWMLPGGSHWAFGLLVLAMLSEGFYDFFVSVLRAKGHYSDDARLGVQSAWIYSIPLAGTAWLTNSVDGVAIAFFVSRFCMAIQCQRVLISRNIRISWLGILTAWSRLCACTSYATDYAMTAMFGQVDGILLNHYIGATAVGLHQAGMRLFMAAAQLAPILANVFLPRVSAAAVDGAGKFHSESMWVQLAFVLAGGTVDLVFSFGAPLLVNLAFGPDYQQLIELMPWFGLLFQVRFAAAAWGITLTSQGRQSYRAVASTMHWMLTLVLAVVWIPMFAGKGWLMALVAGNASLWLAYVGRVMTCGAADQSGASVFSVLLVLLVILAILFQSYLLMQ
jgi:O-antigen/teichoic acid export membrane protein